MHKLDEKALAAAPERLWLGAANDDHEREVWFDDDEGGVPYVRADLAAAPSPAPVAVKDGWAEIVGQAKHVQLGIACKYVGIIRSVEILIDLILAHDRIRSALVDPVADEAGGQT